MCKAMYIGFGLIATLHMSKTIYRLEMIASVAHMYSYCPVWIRPINSEEENNGWAR